jgi:hypothetical protein
LLIISTTKHQKQSLTDLQISFLSKGIPILVSHIIRIPSNAKSLIEGILATHSQKKLHIEIKNNHDPINSALLMK